jgi:DNA-binding response OmpR family regulator
MKKILLADDDAAIRQTLGQLLTLEQYEVIPAANGREAAAKFIAEPPDLVLLDLNMPERDGWDVLNLMSGTHPLIPIIIITAESQQYEHAARLSVDALMEKPLDLPILLKTIRDFTAESEPERLWRLSQADSKTLFLGPRVHESYQGKS